MHPDSKLSTCDEIISAEILYKVLDPHLYEVVADVIIYGPCGLSNKGSVYD